MREPAGHRPAGSPHHETLNSCRLSSDLCPSLKEGRSQECSVLITSA